MTKRKIIIRGLTACIIAAMTAAGVHAYQQQEKSFSPDKGKQEIKENHVVFRDKQKDRKNLEDTSGESNLWDKNRIKNKEMDLSEIMDSSILFEQNQKNRKSTQKRYSDNENGKKQAVNLSADDKDTNGRIKVTKDTPVEGRPGDEKKPGQPADKEPGNKDGDNKNKQEDTDKTGDNISGTAGPAGTGVPGDEKNDRPEVSIAPPYFPTAYPNVTKEPERTARPHTTPVVTSKPAPPEKTPTPPKGDNLIESLYPKITDYPVDGQDESQGKLHLNIIPIMNSDREEYIYYGSSLTKEKLLCSVLVYVLDDKNRVLYRIKDFNDNFKIGTFPETAEENFTVSFMFRQNSLAPWQTIEYQYEVLPYKYFVVDHDRNLFAQETPKEPGINLLGYYSCNLTEEQRQELNKNNEFPITDIIPYWTDDETGIQVSDQYQGTQKGWTVFRPADSIPVETGYEAALKRYLDLDDFGYCANLKYLQTLTKIPEGTMDLKVMQGIHWVDLKGDTLNTLELAASTAVVDVDDLEVQSAYQAPEDNPYFVTKDGVLYSKDETKLKAVPSLKRELEVPSGVKDIHIPAKNSIQKIVLSSAEPPVINLENLKDTIIWVPESLYNIYYLKYEKLLPESVKLMKDSGDQSDLIVQDDAVLSGDGSVLYYLMDTVKGNYTVPDSVRVIMPDALKNCNELYEVILPAQRIELEKDSLSSESLKKLVFMGSDAPLIEEGAFDTEKVHVMMTPEMYQSWDADKRPTSVEKCSLSLEEKDGYRYLKKGNERVLLKVPENVSLFNGDCVGDMQIDEVASGAFNGCRSLLAAELPEQVKTIDSYAFIDCDKLQGVLCDSENIIRVEDQAFGDCSHIRFLAYEAAKAEFADGYCPQAIGFCKADAEGYPKTQMVPHLTYQLAWAQGFFLEGTPETGIYLYGDYQFEDVLSGTYLIAATDNISGRLHLRKDVVEIIFYAFKDCRNEFTIDFTEYPDLFSICEWAFKDSGLSGDVTLPENLRYLDGYCFSGCKKITSLHIESELLETIPMYAFSGDSGLKSIDISKTCPLKYIELYAFSSTGIENITLPETVEEIVERAFMDCKDLKSITLLGMTPPQLTGLTEGDEFTFGIEMTDTFQIVVPEEAKEQYLNAWKKFADHITGQQDDRRDGK